MAQASYKYTVQSPTRVDLAGGTLDLWPLWAFYGPCQTLNVAINIFTAAELIERSDSRVILHVEDLNFHRDYQNLEAALYDTCAETVLLRAHLNYWMPQRGFELTTRSESPVGGGLGGSSSLSMSLIKLFSFWLERPVDPLAMVVLASNIEARVLHVPTGVQDYYPALQGGLSRLEFGSAGTKWSLMNVNLGEFAARALLVYTGRPHHSGLNNWQVLKQAIESNPNTETCLKRLGDIADRVASTLEKENWDLLPSLLNEEFKWRVQLSPVFSSPEIERLQKMTVGKGALAAKICGAGGGGCVMLWCEKGKKEVVSELCRSEEFQVLRHVEPVKKLAPVEKKAL